MLSAIDSTMMQMIRNRVGLVYQGYVESLLEFQAMVRDNTVVRVGVQVIVRKNDVILFVRRAHGYGKGTWCLPCGHLEPGETIAQCGLRELREEAGVHGAAAKVIAVTDPLEAEPAAGYHIQIGVEVKEWSGTPHVVDPTECTDVRFFAGSALPEEIFLPSREVLRKVFEGRLY